LNKRASTSRRLENRHLIERFDGPSMGFAPKIRFAETQALEGAVRSELVSEAKFPARRENTGISSILAFGHLHLSSK